MEELHQSGEAHAQIEKVKAQFGGRELAGKTLGVVGLGAIGAAVLKAALDLRMEVVGFYPVRSPRFEVLRCLHAIDATRGDETRAWVVFFLILRPFGPSRDRETPFRPNRLKFGPETTHELVR